MKGSILFLEVSFYISSSISTNQLPSVKFGGYEMIGGDSFLPYSISSGLRFTSSGNVYRVVRAKLKRMIHPPEYA